jgi:hypothetical protein
MIKKDLLYFLEDFSDEAEVCFWSNGKAREIKEVKNDELRNIVLLK